jgi:XisI protein
MITRLEAYRSAIEQVLTSHQDRDDVAVRSEVIVDREHDHYQLVNVGWQNDRRVYGCVLHLDIVDGKVWIQYNGTEFDIANELVALGVGKQHIVLGFQSPFKRQFTEFAVC